MDSDDDNVEEVVE
ncbi:uncharacterized, partial [Tachysurus ichikawai]